MKPIYKPLLDEQKRRLGSLIRYHRNKLSMTQEQFIKNGICSRATLSAIENGKVIKQDMVYYEILEKMKMIFIPDAIWDEQYVMMSDTLLDAFMRMEETTIEQLQQRVERLFSKKIGMCYYELLYTSTCCILQYARTHKSDLSYEKYKEIMEMLDMYPQSMRILLLHLCFLYSFTQTEDIAEIETHWHTYIHYADHVLLKMDLYRYQQETGTAGMFSEKAILSELSAASYWNFYYLFQSQIAVFKTRAIMKQQQESYVAFYEHIMDGKIKLHPTVKHHILRNLVTLFYSEFHDDQKTYDILQYVKQQDPQSYGSWYEVLYVVCAEKIGENVEVSPIVQSKDTIFLYYFYMKYHAHATTQDLLDYIMYVILPVLKQHKESQLVTIFKEQLEELLCKGESKRYKDYFDFLIETKI